MMQAKVVLPGLFADNMVLQQETEAALWGKAEPGAKVAIAGSWSKSKVTVAADADGRWFARIATPKAGGPSFPLQRLRRSPTLGIGGRKGTWHP